MLSSGERTLVKWVAKTSPWLAPLPSGYFVARAAQTHLKLPLAMAVVIGLIIELLGIASVHSWLWLVDWNINKRKSDPEAPAVVAMFLGGTYLVATIGLTVMLEVVPVLATYSPAIFPVLAVVGAINLTLIAQQEQRESIAMQGRLFRQKRVTIGQSMNSHAVISPNHQVDIADNPLEFAKGMDGARNQKKLDTMKKIVNILNQTPGISIQKLAKEVGCSRTTVYKYLDELKASSRKIDEDE